MSFRMRLTALPSDAYEYEVLQFQAHFHDDSGQAKGWVDPVRGPVVGRDVEYGALFAYLWRRFGCPNANWNASRLVRYVLSTPQADMFLIVEPSIVGVTSQVFSFVAPARIHAAAEDYRRAIVAIRAQGEQGFWDREQDLRYWGHNDPLTPFAQAAARTLQELLRPVQLDEDGAIDIFGGVPRMARAMRPAVVRLRNGGVDLQAS